jgi:spermidine/putrescine transport system ATP-binding protein
VHDVDVRLVQVSKAFGDVYAVDHIDLEVFDGEFFSLLGPSGCGKTTTLRMIGGFEQPTSGRIELQGEDVTWLPPFKRQVNTVFQNYALFPHLSIYENVAFGLRRQKVKGAEIKSRVTDMLKLVELPGFEDRKPTQISGGQAQRVALARALINRPAVLLLDEPLGALDALTRLEMQGLIERVWQEHRFTAVLVTHDVEEAVALADRIIVLSEGQIALDLRIDLPRPRDHAALRFTELKATVLDEVLGTRHERGARMHALSSAPADITSERLVRTA